MRLSMLASSALVVGFMSLSTAAYAGCGSSLTCNSNQGYSSYSSGYSGGYSSSYSTSSYGGTASCPAGTRASSDGTCLMNETTSLYSGGSSYSSSYTPSTNYSSSYSSSSYTPSTSYSSYSSSYTPSYSSGYSSSSSSSACPSGSSRGVDGLCMSHNSGSSYSSGGSYSSSSYSSGGSTIVPFSTSVANISITALTAWAPMSILAQPHVRLVFIIPAAAKFLAATLLLSLRLLLCVRLL